MRLRSLLAVSMLFAGMCAVEKAKAESGSTLSLANPSSNVPDDWLTTAERSEFRQTDRYDATVAYCRRLAGACEWLEYQSFGTSPEGRDLPLVIASKDKAFTPQAARASTGDGKLVVLVQNCIHAGECAGKDASLMLLRDICLTKTRSDLLDHVTLLVVPIFNADGHERFSPYSRINQNGPEAMGWRVTSRNLNLNRDYTKADAVEMRALISLWNAWHPDFHVDNHTTDGGDWQYDLTYEVDDHQAATPQVARWLDDVLLPHLDTALRADGHLPMDYFGLVDPKDPAKGIRSGGFGPRYSTGYAAVRNRPSVLVETHMLKPYRTRVIGHYDIMLHMLEVLNHDPDSLRSAVREADQATITAGSNYDPNVRWPLAVERTETSIPFTFAGYAYRRELSEVSGGVRIIYDNTKPIEFDTVWFKELKGTKELRPPLAYIIPPQWNEVIDVIRLHGLKTRQLTEPLSESFESYRFENVHFPERPYEGRFQPTYKTIPITEERTYRSGSVIVPLNQPDARLAVHLLEPEGPDSLLAWGFFNAIFEQKEYAEDYVAEKLARDMMDAEPQLREEFQERVRTDPEFASDLQARLDFFYRRSPYWDQRKDLYPISRITKAVDLELGSKVP